MSSVLLPEAPEPLTGTVSSLDLSALGQCWNGTLEVVRSLELEGFPPEKLFLRRNPFLRQDDVAPCGFIYHSGTRMDNSAGTTSETALHYLISVAYLWASGRDAINGEGLANAAIERTIVAFSKKPAREIGFVVDAEGASLRDCKVDAAETLNEQAMRLGALVKFITIDYFMRLPYREGL